MEIILLDGLEFPELFVIAWDEGFQDNFVDILILYCSPDRGVICFSYGPKSIRIRNT